PYDFSWHAAEHRRPPGIVRRPRGSHGVGAGTSTAGATMSILDCSITTPPRIEEGAVVFMILHEPSGEVFRCRMVSADDVNLALAPSGFTPHADGDVRGAVAEAALLYSRQNAEFDS